MFMYYASTSPQRRMPVIPTMPKKIHRRRSKHILCGVFMRTLLAAEMP